MTTPWHDSADDDDGDDWSDEEDDGERLSAAELPDPADTDGPADDAEAVPCPFCGRAIYEFADVCPGCHNFVGGSDDPAVIGGHRARPGWFTVTVIAVLVATLVTCVARLW